MLESKMLVVSVRKHPISSRKRNTKPGKFCELQQEAGLKMKTLEKIGTSSTQGCSRMTTAGNWAKAEER